MSLSAPSHCQRTVHQAKSLRRFAGSLCFNLWLKPDGQTETVALGAGPSFRWPIETIISLPDEKCIR